MPSVAPPAPQSLSREDRERLEKQMELEMKERQVKAAKPEDQQVAKRYDPNLDKYAELKAQLPGLDSVSHRSSRGTAMARLLFEGVRNNDIQSLEVMQAYITAALSGEYTVGELETLGHQIATGTADPAELAELISAAREVDSVDAGLSLPNFDTLSPEEQQDFMVEMLAQAANFEQGALRSSIGAVVGKDLPAKLAGEALREMEAYLAQVPRPSPEEVTAKYSEMIGKVIVGVAIARGLNSTAVDIVTSQRQEIEKQLREMT